MSYVAHPIPPHENEPMLSDDVYRDRLEKTLVELESWANETRASADIRPVNASTKSGTVSARVIRATAWTVASRLLLR